MRYSFAPLRKASISTLAVLVLVSACGEDPVTPDPSPALTLENAWPNDDGHEWTYDMTVTQYDDVTPTLYDSAASVPPIPPLTQIAEQLSMDVAETPDSTSFLGYKMWFAGVDTTESGIVAQSLRGEVIGATPAKIASRAFSERLLRLVFAAKPSMQERLLADHGHAGSEDRILNHSHGPLFIGEGFFFLKTDEYIGGANDFDTVVRLRWLESDLAVGHEWTEQLVPQFADDVFIHARVLGSRTVTVPSGTYDNVLEVVYALDLGIAERLDSSANSLGFYRATHYATIAYAPNVGPIRVHERFFAEPDVFPHPFVGLVDLVMEHRLSP